MIIKLHVLLTSKIKTFCLCIISIENCLNLLTLPVTAESGRELSPTCDLTSITRYRRAGWQTHDRQSTGHCGVLWISADRFHGRAFCQNLRNCLSDRPVVLRVSRTHTHSQQKQSFYCGPVCTLKQERIPGFWEPECWYKKIIIIINIIMF